MGDINLKRKVTLKRKSESLPSGDSNTTNKKSKKGLIIGLLLLLLVGVGILYTMLNRGADSNTLPQDSANGVVDSTSNEVNPSESGNTMNNQESINKEGVDYNDEKVANHSEVVDYSNTQETSKSEMESVASDRSTTPERTSTDEKVSNEVSKKSSQKNTSSISSIEDKARRVIRGDYGNGRTRKSKLGDEYTIIQKKVNELYRNGNIK